MVCKSLFSMMVNPNGFTIEGFTIIENKDLQTIKR